MVDSVKNAEIDAALFFFFSLIKLATVKDKAVHFQCSMGSQFSPGKTESHVTYRRKHQMNLERDEGEAHPREPLKKGKKDRG